MLKNIIYLVKNDKKLIKKILKKIIKNGFKETIKQGINRIRANSTNQYFTNPNKIVSKKIGLNNKNINILTTKHTIYAANLLKKSLNNLNFTCEIQINSQTEYLDCLYIVICPQMFNNLPSVYISYQMEQSVSSRWFTKSYFNILKNSYAILDYSINNIDFIQKNNLSYKQLFFLPIGIYKDYKKYLFQSKQWDGTVTEDTEVLFYGDASNERRKKYLNELKKHFKVKIISEKYGNDLYRELLSAKIIVNIHYYENELLESTRIYECLSLGLNVVSESSIYIDEYTSLNNIVNFTEIGNIDEMIKVIYKQLQTNPSSTNLIKDDNQFDFYLSRMLLSFDLIKYEELIKYIEFKNIKKNKNNFYCLGMPENTERRKSFNLDNKYGISIFDGLRHSQGWIGCGLSYKYLLSYAKKNDLEYIIICEDDVEFNENFQEELNNIVNYLKKTKNKWNIFSGLIANLNSNTNINNIDSYINKEFIYIDKMTSTVFNIYHKSFFDKIINWDNMNFDANENTIDRYIESQGDLKVVTTNPFLVGHKEDQISSLWHFKNNKYLDMFKETNELFIKKINEFKNK